MRRTSLHRSFDANGRNATVRRALIGAAGLLAALSAGAGPAAAETFYVSPSGSDRASGRSADAAWKTAQRVSRANLGPGDRVLFQGGGMWREMLEPEGDGAPGNPIVIGTYGSGKAVFTGQNARGYAGIAVIRRSWLRFENLELRDRSGQDVLVYLEGVHDVVFDRMLLPQRLRRLPLQPAAELAARHGPPQPHPEHAGRRRFARHQRAARRHGLARGGHRDRARARLLPDRPRHGQLATSA